jgi:hypothetical protein
VCLFTNAAKRFIRLSPSKCRFRRFLGLQMYMFL